MAVIALFVLQPFPVSRANPSLFVYQQVESIAVLEHEVMKHPAQLSQKQLVANEVEKFMAEED